MPALLVLLILLVPFTGWSQDADPPGGYRFQPPRPPPLDSSDLEEVDEEDDDFEMGDEGSSIEMANPPPPQAAPPMPGGLPPPSTFNASAGSGKLRFQLVEGEFWEKGKKRQRGDRQKR